VWNDSHAPCLIKFHSRVRESEKCRLSSTKEGWLHKRRQTSRPRLGASEVINNTAMMSAEQFAMTTANQAQHVSPRHTRVYDSMDARLQGKLDHLTAVWRKLVTLPTECPLSVTPPPRATGHPQSPARRPCWPSSCLLSHQRHRHHHRSAPQHPRGRPHRKSASCA
jgi:hypothetical protein